MIELGYWKLRGLVGGIRLLLEYCGEEWNETFYELHKKEDGSWDRSEWINVKSTDEMQNGWHFPNLPWLKDGDVKMTQSTAILKYIARKNKIGQELSSEEAWRVDLAEGQITDVRGAFATMSYGRGNFMGQDWDNNRQELLEKTFASNLGQFDSFLGSNKWMAGETLTFVDFMFWEFLDHLRMMYPPIFEGKENLKAYQSRFENLEKVKAYMTSDRYMKAPLNGKMAKWGGDSDPKPLSF